MESIDDLRQGHLQPLAVVGLSFRFPSEATSPKDFWRMMVEKRCASTETPKDRFNIDAHHHPDSNRLDSISARGGHFITGDVSAFDAPFFSVGAAEAEAMDPLQRLTLETAYRAVENAGIPLERISGTKTCVFSGSSSAEYATMQHKDPHFPAKYHGTGTVPNNLANRISWFFNLTSTSANIDSACSSSLLALDMVCQSIWGGDSSMGLACGSSILLSPDSGLALDNLGMLGKDSRCYSFDHRANGFARGEGFGVVVVKPLKAALADGDTIRAVIRSSCSNQDGKTPGLTQPSKEAQERLIEDTYAKAGLDMSKTRYFEAHGTGTPVGDPIEAGAIGTTFRRYRSRAEPLYLGSVKSNIGHLEGASGIAGVIKAILALEAGIVPPNSNFEKLSPKIDAEFLHIMVPESATPWPSNGLRRVSVQSFGFGGANSHVILDDAYNFLWTHDLQGNHSTATLPPDGSQDPKYYFDHDSVASSHGPIINGDSDKAPEKNGLESSASQIFVWSVADEGGIERLKSQWRDHFTSLQIPRAQRSRYLRDLAHTLSTRRTHLPFRTFASTDEFSKLSTLVDRMSPVTKANSAPQLAFVFTGQGSQWHAMGRELIFRYPVYRGSLSESTDHLRSLSASFDVMEELLRDESETRVNGALYSQVLCTAVQMALVDLMQSFGINPAVVVGHSSGEVAAAYCAGALSKQVALKISYYRGFLASQLPARSQVRGAMVAVGLSETEALPYIKRVMLQSGHEGLVVACVNSPKSVTVSGDAVQVAALMNELGSNNIFARQLRVDVAYHSFQMKEIAADYLELLGDLPESDLQPNKKTPLMASSVTGTWTDRSALSSAKYWVDNMVSPVVFSQALSLVCASTSSSKTKKIDGSHRKIVNITDILEVGPHSALQGPVKDVLSASRRSKSIVYSSLLVRKVAATESVIQTAGRLHCAGHPTDLTEVNQACIQSASASAPKAFTLLPQYCFNHAKSYWHEGRISRGYRFRKFPRHDLLGVQDSDWNPLEARWRNIINFSDVPWVEEHKINGVILYPAAGMMVMAIEAAKQLADPSKVISGFVFKNAAFHSPLSVSSSGTEVNLFLRPRRDNNNRDEGWHEFRVYTNDGSGWHENCNGSIQTLYTADVTEVGQGREQIEWRDAHVGAYAAAKEACTEKVNIDWLYDRVVENGYAYGPSFRAITALWHNFGSQTVTEVRTFKWSDHYEGPDTALPHVIHPTTFDCILQSILASYSSGGTKKMSTAIPTHFERIWIANHGLSGAEADHVKVYASTHRAGLRETVSNVVALDATGFDVLVEVERFKTTDIDNVEADEEGKANISTNLCHNIDWKPDLDLLSSRDIRSLCKGRVPLQFGPSEFLGKIDFLLAAAIKRTMSRLSEGQISTLSQKPHTAAYLTWMRHKLELLEDGASTVLTAEQVSRLEDTVYVDEVAGGLSRSNTLGAFYATIAGIHEDLLTGKKDPLSVLFQGNLVRDFYYALWESVPCTTRCNPFWDALVHKNPACKILEVGAGTGATTHLLMKTLTTHGDGERCVPRYGTYDYTDVSPFFFASAREIYRDHGSKMHFRTLNIENDPEIQGFERESYDVVVAAAVLHATKYLKQTLENCRKLLKPGGKLILWEITTPNGLRTNFAFGLLEGWWLSAEPFRQYGPCVAEDTWDALLKETGFSGCDFDFKDYEDPACHEFSVLCSTAVGLEETHVKEVPSSEVIIVHADGQNELGVELQADLDRFENVQSTAVSLDNHYRVLDRAHLVLVFVLELDGPICHDLGEELFKTLHDLMTAAAVSNILWVTSIREDEACPPFSHMISGLARSLNSEDDSNRIVCLSLQSSHGTPSGLDDRQRAHIARLARSLRNSDGLESEYVERDGFLHVPRLIESTKLNDTIYHRELPHQVVQRPWKGNEPLRLVVGSPGLLNTLHFIEDKDYSQPLDPEAVEVEVRTVGFNFRDVLIALGRLNTDRVGCECAGVISRLGSAVSSDLAVGDRVAGCCFDSYKSYVRIDWRGLAKIPDEMSFSVAASLPANYCTAWRSLHHIARVQPGETVLIHSAAGGTGQAAVQVAKYLGATIFATVGTNAKKQFLIERYGVQPDHIFSSRDTEFARSVKRLTGGKGVDLIFNSLSGEGLVASWECIAPFGRFIEIGKKDILGRNKLPMSHFEHNVSFNAVDISLILRDKPQILRDALREVFQLMAKGDLVPVEPLQAYSVSDLEKAFRNMQAGKTSGKMVIEMNPDNVVEATLDTRPSFYFDPNATYIIAGGLGGIGRSVTTWFVARGARHLILLSRSGSHSVRAQELLGTISDEAVQIKIPACDIGDRGALESKLVECLCDMPPVKGCIQAAMVLHDTAFESMTFKAWTAATRVKVQGTWNLHSLLPADLDFFIMFSSVAGVCGSKGQSNYAAGNVFQDALAHHRVAWGQKATSLDLGPFFSVGIMAQNSALKTRWQDLVDAPVTEADLFALLDYYCDPSTPTASSDLLSQTAVGLARGIRVDSGSAYYLRKPMFANLALSGVNSTAEAVIGGAQHDHVDFAAVFATAYSTQEVMDALHGALKRKLAATLSLSADQIQTNAPMHSYGVDSLVAVEIRNWFAKELKADIAIFDILGGSTVATVSLLAASKSRFKKTEASAE